MLQKKLQEEAFVTLDQTKISHIWHQSMIHIRETINSIIKIKQFDSLKDIIKRMERQKTEEKGFFQMSYIIKDLYSK